MPDRVIKNPNRSVEDVVEARIPQYKKLGIDPSKMEYKSSVVPDQLPVDTKNISNKKLPIRQDYGIKENLPIGNATLPNIGNSYEHTWTAENEEELDENKVMIDNNDFVGPEDSPYIEEDQVPLNYSGDDCFYVVVVSGVVLKTGQKKEIEAFVKALLYGESEFCKNNEPVDIKDLLVLKKVNIKVGVFLD